MTAARVLCVDDDPDVLEGIEQHLIRHFDVRLALGGLQALEKLQREGPFAVVMSDMRMPDMNGATLLAKVRGLSPNSVRMLLTGQTDLGPAIAAINDGQIFRFLLKPCAPHELKACFEQATEQHRLLTAEQDLLARTLRASVEALVEALALTSPLAFGRSKRIHQHVVTMCEELALNERWHIEIAALVGDLGALTLSDEVFERYYYGQPLSAAESKLVREMPQAGRRLLVNIPRLEPVLDVLAATERIAAQGKKGAPQGALVLQIARDLDELEARGMARATAVEALSSRGAKYDAAALDALTRRLSHGMKEEEVREIRLAGLREGMIFAEDVRLASGALLAARGYLVTPSFAVRAQGFQRGQVREPLRVVVPRKVQRQ